jgi:hypothetical protein
MADLTYIQATLETKIVGQDATGNNANFVGADTHGSLQAGIFAPNGTAITADTPGTAGNERLHIAVPDTTTASTVLGALNATVSITMAGLSSVGFQIAAGTLIGTLVPECSIDGGTTWVSCTFFDPINSAVASSIVFGSSNTLKVVSVLPIGGSSNVRIRVSIYTSGTANALMRASEVTGAAGAITASAYSTITNTFVGTGSNTATLVLAANPNRKYAYFSNGTGTQINIQFGATTGLSTTTGIPLIAKSFYELKGDNLFTGNVYAFAASNVTLSVSEGTP